MDAWQTNPPSFPVDGELSLHAKVDSHIPQVCSALGLDKRTTSAVTSNSIGGNYVFLVCTDAV